MDLQRIRDEARLYSELQRINSLRQAAAKTRQPADLERYYEAYYSTAFPLACRSLQAALADRQELSNHRYHTMVMPLSFHPEPHTLLISVFQPERLLLLYSDEANDTTRKQMMKYAPELFPGRDVEALPFNEPGLERCRRILRDEAFKAHGTVLVDVTGYTKESSVNLAFAARETGNCDLVYLKARTKSQADNLSFLNTGQEIILWYGKDLHTATLQLDRAMETLAVSCTDGKTLSFSCMEPGSLKLAEHPYKLPEQTIVSQALEPFCSSRPPKLDRLVRKAAAAADLLIPSAISRLLRASQPCDIFTLDLDTCSACIPWELLPVSEEQPLGLSRLCRRTLPVTEQSGSTCETASILFIADPTGDEQLDCTDELNTLKQAAAEHQYRLTVLSGSDASINGVLEQLGTHGIVHFSGHTENSSLCLADGLLTPEQISNCRTLPSLAVLNSCRSADPVLAAAFLQAGTRRFIGNRWDLSNSRAAAFTGAFYPGCLPYFSVRSGLNRCREELENAEEILSKVWYERKS